MTRPRRRKWKKEGKPKVGAVYISERRAVERKPGMKPPVLPLDLLLGSKWPRAENLYRLNDD